MRHPGLPKWMGHRSDAMNTATIETAYRLAKERYAEMGVDTDRALERLAADRRLDALLAGGRRRRLRDRGRADRRRDHGHRQLSRQGPDARRAARRHREGAEPDPRQAPRQPPRDVPGDRRQARRAQPDRAQALPAVDRLGQAAGDRHGLQSRPTSRIPRRPTASRWPTPTRASAASGSSTASPAARSARRSAGPWARPA